MRTKNTDRQLARLMQLLVLWLVLATVVTAAMAQPTLPNGLQLDRFEVRVAEPAVTGAVVTVEITFKNVSGQPMQFDPGVGIFVGARLNSTTDANSRDFGHDHKGLLLKPEAQVTLRATRPLDAAGEWRFWPAYRMNGQWGPFRWQEKTVQVYASAAEARGSAGSGAGTETAATLTVAQLLAKAANYDGKRVTVTGDALIVRQQKDAGGKPWTLISLVDIENKKMVMNVIGTGGPAAVGNGDVVRATGLFKVKSQRGRYAYDNELVCESSSIVRNQQQTADKLADDKNDSRSVIDLRKAVGRQFDMGLLREKPAAIGAEVAVRFPTRQYAQVPKRNTIVGTGSGTAAIRVEQAEQRKKVGGPGSTPAGADKNFLILRLSVRGNTANNGMPENFSQSFVSYDPGPVFVLVDRTGTVYWPEAVLSSTATYSDKGAKPLGDIPINSAAWTRSALVFKVPATIQEPVLLVVTLQGENRFEYNGIRLH